MASLGTFLLLASFVTCSYAAVVSVGGARRRSRRLIESGIGAFYLVTALMTVASAVIINAFLTNDYSIKYVAHYSDDFTGPLTGRDIHCQPLPDRIFAGPKLSRCSFVNDDQPR